ncbi:MAG: FAD-binding oxidoreductase [Desulfarculaceae bacterium]|nr:FAD-binding oxidoreductase [Desulfarculaceae bacterium]MCF8071571.1 FAD-binding oxidoreductase [Desulfarculaceae bacterium]MCF8102386.1 FAD-binding oxidoreductase [Desulfarculaceae bacterium]MCF8114850.1 FAD-binding oxidoreductase [Desulfarculaceae bacterium]
MSEQYGKVTDEIAARLGEIVGSGNLMYGDAEAMEDYAGDEAGPFFRHAPEAVVKPESTEQVAQIMKLANQHRIAVVARGAGSGLAGAATPLQGGIVLSLEKMNHILEIDMLNRVVVAEPGVVTNDLCRTVAEQGLMYAGYPMSTETSFIGGNVATNAGGGKVIKYGNTRAHVLGLEVVTPTGEVMQLGGKYRKDTWGYNLFHLVVGSEGTLAVVTKVYLNLVPLPGKTVDLLVPFPDIDTAVSSVAALVRSPKVTPVAVEYMDQYSVILATRYFNTSWPLQDTAQAYLIVQLEGADQEELEEQYENAGDICLEQGAMDVFVAESRSDSHNLWKVRQEWGPAVRAADATSYSACDVVVPLGQVPAFMAKVAEMENERKMRIPTVAHIADGNFHPKSMRPEGLPLDQWPEVAESVYHEMIQTAVELGGAGSGEHGVGYSKRPMFLANTPPHQLEILKGIKQVFDPNGILNPGKIF